jgi:tetratricopeptide (TPR) repeat protein
MLSKKMVARLFVIGFVLIFLTSAVVFFSINQSYQLSLEARFYYFLGEYPKALDLSKDALKIDKYNKMAFTIEAQSRISLEFIAYIMEANNYLMMIDDLSKEQSSREIQLKVKMISEIMIEKYFKLKMNYFLIDEELKNKATKSYLKFLELYSDIVGREQFKK